jgi:hypothetical protein
MPRRGHRRVPNLKPRSVAFVPGTVFKRYGPLSLSAQEAELGSPGSALLASEPGTLLVELPQPDFRGSRGAAFVQAVQSFELWGYPPPRTFCL